MKVSKYRSPDWSILSIYCFLAALFPFYNFWVAADLGYDSSPHGQAILKWWFYALLGLIAAGIGFAVVAVKSWWSSRQLSKDAPRNISKQSD